MAGPKQECKAQTTNMESFKSNFLKYILSIYLILAVRNLFLANKNGILIFQVGDFFHKLITTALNLFAVVSVSVFCSYHGERNTGNMCPLMDSGGEASRIVQTVFEISFFCLFCQQNISYCLGDFIISPAFFSDFLNCKAIWVTSKLRARF